MALCAKENDFHCVHTYANVARTPQKMEIFLRQLQKRDSNASSDLKEVLILDEFESLIREPTSIKWLLKFVKSQNEVPIVVVCNAADKSFVQLEDLSTVVEFEPLKREPVYSTLLRLSEKVSTFCHLPPMDCYFIAATSSGDISQTVNQVQMLYSGKKPLVLSNGPKRRRTTGSNPSNKISTECQKDSSLLEWSKTHRATSVQHFLKQFQNTCSILETVSSMDRDFMTSLGDNLVKEYLLYFHNGSDSTLEKVAECAEYLSTADCGLASQEEKEDRLYESENSDLWSKESILLVGGLSSTLRILNNRNRSEIDLKKKKRKFRRFSYP